MSNPNFAFSYPAGLSMISLGAMPQRPEPAILIADILGLDGGSGETWPTGIPPQRRGVHHLVGQHRASRIFTGRPLAARGGCGRAAADDREHQRRRPRPDGDFQRQVVTGWNQVGNPFPKRDRLRHH
jgi:hypothetical protein